MVDSTTDGAGARPRYDPTDRSARNAGRHPEVVSVADATGDPDRDGDPPHYPDIVRASISRGRSELTLGLVGGGRFPARMPDEASNYVVGFTVEAGSDEYFVSAEADSDGWVGRIARNQQERRFMGEVALDGSQVMITIPLDAIGGRRAFSWHVDSSWTRQSSITEFSLDRAPDVNEARFRPRT